MSQPFPLASPDAAALPPDSAPGPASGPEKLLGGHHRSWQVRRGSPGPGGAPAPLIKTGIPHRGVPRFDPRCVLDEDGLLRELGRRGLPRIPRAHRSARGLQNHDYIEGIALSRLKPPGTRLTARQLDDLIELFTHLATVTPGRLALLHSCPPAHRPRTSADFLRALLRFTRERVYRRNSPRFPGLLTALGVGPRILAEDGPLARSADRLTDRPFCLLHGDLHRDNLIVAAGDGALWTIDWELALLGDPLYDLATHLHLMRYPRAQERVLLGRWAAAMEAVRPGASAGMSRDLTRYLHYKRVQSVVTDGIRNAQAVSQAPPERLAGQLADTGRQLSRALQNAAVPLGLARVPSPGRIARLYTELVPPGTEIVGRTQIGNRMAAT
jgi:dihydroneopterin aldolase